MRNRLIALCLLLVSAGLSAQDFNTGWTFWYDGHEKETVDLPHDAMIHRKRNADVPSGASVAYYEGGRYYYEKKFIVPDEWLDKHVTFEFEGIYMNSEIYINGQKAGGIHYGYLPVHVDADGLLHAGENTIRVIADNSRLQDSRWYSGAGIYRPVHLRVRDKENVSSVRITTLSHSPARIRIVTRHGEGDVEVRIIGNGKEIMTASGDDLTLTIPDAHLWSDEHPFLYTAEIRLINDGRTLDTVYEPFGIRMLEWSAEKGLLVNGIETKLRGGCLHADNGILGMAEYEDAAVRKIRILKSYGFNAIRSAHQPCSEAMLKACDELGMYIMDELWDMWFKPKNVHDYGNWFMENFRTDIEATVEKDYNHPSVILYSIGNEVSEPGTEEGMRIAHAIIDHLHACDPTRPATAGINLAFMAPGGVRALTNSALGGEKKTETETVIDGAVNVSLIFNEAVQSTGMKFDDIVVTPMIDSVTSPIMDALDIAGYNYAVPRYKIEPLHHPDRIIVGSETYPPDIFDTWQQVKEMPYVIGDFMWTAWDYLGEVGAGAWTYAGEGTGFSKPFPWKLANSGAIDILGNPTGQVFLNKAAWQQADAAPILSVRPVREDPIIGKSIWRSTNSIPSWSWRGREGIPAIVEVYTTADLVKLTLNGKEVAQGKPAGGSVFFRLPYQPGILRAEAFKEGRSLGADTLTSASGELHIGIHPEESRARTGHLLYVNIALEGENGEVESAADTRLHIEVDGAKLLGFGSARAISEEDYDSGDHTTYYGRAQAIVKADKPGSIRISVCGENLEKQIITVPCI